MRYKIALLLLPLVVSSCKLDYTPENAITYTNAFASESELNTTTSSIHFYMNNCMDAVSVLTQAGLRADETQSADELREWNPQTILQSGADWTGVYDMIFEANLLLDNIHRTQGLTEDRYNYHTGQAHFALGLGSFLLSRGYGEAVVTANSKEIRIYPLSSMLDVVNKAIEHAERAYSVLPTYDKLRSVSGGTLSSKQYASKGNAAALLAHLYAWKGSIIDLYGISGETSQTAYQKSVEYSTKIIGGEAGAYSLVSTPEDLCKLLSNPEANNPEEIFSLAYDKSRSNTAVTHNDVASAFAMWPVDKTKTLGDIATASFRLLKSTILTLYPDASDKRRQAFFYKFNEAHVVDGKDYAIPYKFREAVFMNDASAPSGLSFVSINANYVYWRLADIYLLRAECYVKLGNEGLAKADLNKIRERAGAAAYPRMGESDLKLAIFREREREFLMENDSRYYDILRNGYYRTELLGKFQQLSASDVAGGALSLPIPQSAWQDRDGKIVNHRILQRKYWNPYM